MVGSAFQTPFSDRETATNARHSGPDTAGKRTLSASREPSRGEKMAAVRARKMAELFKDQHYRILGEIHLGPSEQYLTPFGNRGRHGYVLKNTATGAKIMVGETILRQAADSFDAIIDLPPPPPKRKRRTREEKAADDAQRAAQRSAQMDAILARFE